MPEKQNSKNDTHKEVTLQLHKEELQLNKKWVDTAEVKVYKKVYTVIKEITVPVTYEELIIEKKTVCPEGTKDGQIETIRIPLSEERIEVSLHPTFLEDVEIYKNQYEELIQISEIIKEEKVRIETVKDVNLMGDSPT